MQLSNSRYSFVLGNMIEVRGLFTFFVEHRKRQRMKDKKLKSLKKTHKRDNINANGKIFLFLMKFLLMCFFN